MSPEFIYKFNGFKCDIFLKNVYSISERLEQQPFYFKQEDQNDSKIQHRPGLFSSFRPDYRIRAYDRGRTPHPETYPG